MKHTILGLLLLYALRGAAQYSPPDTYRDTAGMIHPAWIRYIVVHGFIDDTRLSVSDNGIDFRTIPAGAIREFAVHGTRYVTAAIPDGQVFAEVAIDGRHLRQVLAFSWRPIKVYWRDGVLMLHELYESDRELKSRVYAPYPLLSEMARKGDFDDIHGQEASLIFEAYNKWIDADSIQKKDTSMTLKGVIDANKVKLPHGHHHHNLSELPVIDPESMRNPDYATGYKARLSTRALK